MRKKIKAGLKGCMAAMLRHDSVKRGMKRLLGRTAPTVKNFVDRQLNDHELLSSMENFVDRQLNDHELLSSMEDVDRFLDGIRPDFTERELRQYWDKHHAARRALFGQPEDANPFSSEWRARVVHEYNIVSGRSLNVYENERTPSINPLIHLARPFPYDMKRPSISISNMLYTFSRIFSLVHVEEGQRLVEFGSGWGNAAFQFASAGASVTLVDIEENFLQLAQERFERLGMPLECIHGEFNDVDLPDGHYNYALFMSSFHHCIDHTELLKKIHHSLRDQGRIIFCGEPIDDAFDVPWGMRLDGESLWAIRRNGWLELGFQEKYFRECLRTAGFSVKKHVFSAEKGEIIWIAQKI